MAHIVNGTTTLVKFLKILWLVADCCNLDSVKKQLLVFLVPILLKKKKKAQWVSEIFIFWRQHFLIYIYFLLSNFHIGLLYHTPCVKRF